MPQVFHVCEEGRRQSSFLCPRGTIFNQVPFFFQDFTATSVQEFRVCDWWYNVKCENSAEYFDRNLDLMIQVPPPPPERELIQTHSHSFTQDQQRNSLSSSSSSSSLGLDLSNLVEDGPSLGPFSSKVSFSRCHWNDKILFLQVDFGLLASELGLSDTSGTFSLPF